MNISPTELRAQRELVKRHLEWLDARLAESGEPAAAAVEVAPAPEAGRRIEGGEGAAPTAEVADPQVEALLAAAAGDAQGLSPAAKNGCIFAAIGIALVFLFLLFGLPYLLYGKNGDSGGKRPPAESGDVR